jgi:RimJ/RimL family protein N-acetyltransferase
MESMLYHDTLVIEPVVSRVPRATTSHWRDGVPTLRNRQVMLRELRLSDAQALHALLTTEEVSRFISPPPSTVAGFERFITWTHRQREAGHYVCFAVTRRGDDTAIGLFQIRDLSGGFETAEWGFALGSAFWGTGLFHASARLALSFAFQTLHVHRLEARAAVANGRGNGALQKLGAVLEGRLRRTLCKDGVYLDQHLWAILRTEWHRAHGHQAPDVH